MKKLMLVAVATMFMVAGCEEKKTEKVVEQPKPAAVQAAPAAKAAPAAPEVRAEFKSIDWDKALEMAAAGALLVDVRNPPELEGGMAPNAVNIPLPELKERFAELPKDKDLLVYCRSGRRSEAASNFLVQNGYDRVYNVLGGFLAYPKK